MSSESEIAPASKKLFWASCVVSTLPVLALVMSAVMKFLKPPPVIEGFEKLGFTENHAFGLGIVEVVCTLLYIIPQTSVLGAILLTGYLGGATAAHVRIGDNYAATVILGVLVWLGLYLRDPQIRALIPFRTKSRAIV